MAQLPIADRRFRRCGVAGITDATVCRAFALRVLRRRLSLASAAITAGFLNEFI
jgi:hypothetical protein